MQTMEDYRLWRKIIENIEDGILVFTPDGLRYMNAHSHRFLQLMQIDEFLLFSHEDLDRHFGFNADDSDLVQKVVQKENQSFHVKRNQENTEDTVYYIYTLRSLTRADDLIRLFHLQSSSGLDAIRSDVSFVRNIMQVYHENRDALGRDDVTQLFSGVGARLWKTIQHVEYLRDSFLFYAGGLTRRLENQKIGLLSMLRSVFFSLSPLLLQSGKRVFDYHMDIDPEMSVHFDPIRLGRILETIIYEGFNQCIDKEPVKIEALHESGWIYLKISFGKSSAVSTVSSDESQAASAATGDWGENDLTLATMLLERCGGQLQEELSDSFRIFVVSLPAAL